MNNIFKTKIFQDDSVKKLTTDSSNTKHKSHFNGLFRNSVKISHEKILFFLAIIFFIIYSFFAIKSGTIFNSPDENANYFFSNLFATESKFDYKLPVNSDIIHPRSTTVINNKIVPQSFLGLPVLYGLLAKIFTTSAILFFTPLISAFCVLFFYQIIKKIFDKKIAFVSSILMFLHPGLVYYSTRSLFHNVLFLDLLIIGLYFFIVKKIDYKNIIFGSFFIGLSLITRTSELPWILLLLIILYLFNIKKIETSKVNIIFITITTLIIVSTPIFYINSQLYGHPFSTGYNISNITQDILLIKTDSSNTIITNINSIIRNWWNYGVYIFWWLSIPTYIGLLLILKNYKKLSNHKKQYLIIFLVCSVYLIVYYGIWVFHDNLDPTKITIGTSYIRYWLPIYIFSLPFVSITFLKLKNKNKYANLIFFSLIIYGLLFTYILTEESLAKKTDITYKELKTKILNLTEKNSIIVARYYDKFLFPDRLVIKNIDEEREKKLKEISKLLDNNHLIYYYTWESDNDILHLNGSVLSKYNIKLIDGKIVYKNERLFRFVLKNTKKGK